MLKFINIHSHKNEEIWNAEFKIISILPGELAEMTEGWFYSAGLHPWTLDELSVEKNLAELENFLSHPALIAIGESGLDRARPDIDFKMQEFVFKKHAGLAESAGKPLIIHCVRAYSDLIRIKKELSPLVPWIIHGFQGNGQITEQLLKHGFYLSFGKAIFNNSKTRKILASVNTDRFFLETDESDYNIDELYKKAAEIRNITLPELKKIQAQNFKRIFNIEV
jgi:TatD DNase family protein